MKLKLLSKNYFNYFLQMTLLQIRNESCVTRDGLGSGVTSHEIGISGALSKETGDSVSFKQSLCMYAVHQFSLTEDNYFNFTTKSNMTVSHKMTTDIIVHS